MKILIVTGIFEPESGGPATYAPKIAEKLIGAGHQVSVITYSVKSQYDFDSQYKFKLKRIKRGNKLFNRVRMFTAVFTESDGADVVYMLDWFAAGLPGAIASRMRGVPYVVRVGGDYLWEQKYLESDAVPVSLLDFYKHGLYSKMSYRPFFWLIRWVLTEASKVIFNSDKQRELYEEYYGLSNAATVYNPVPRMETQDVSRGKATHEFVYCGRFIVMKNLTALIRAFAQARIPNDYKLSLIGDGPRKAELARLVETLGLQERVKIQQSMRLPDLFQRIKDCRAFILPSWTDISPNQVYEAMAIGLPAVVTQENYLSIRNQLPEMIDPNSIDDISAKLEMLADDAKYRVFAEAFRAISFKNTWDDVAREHLKIFNEVIQEKS
ncbi:MAG: glycosyltransferase family 4 protein [Candidatus Kaiserbacteria bacterium]|nr:glycosyltransferase family 4 protein [Candidatus Kaiserbacteria bacterium]